MASVCVTLDPDRTTSNIAALAEREFIEERALQHKHRHAGYGFLHRLVSGAGVLLVLKEPPSVPSG